MAGRTVLLTLAAGEERGAGAGAARRRGRWAQRSCSRPVLSCREDGEFRGRVRNTTRGEEIRSSPGARGAGRLQE